MAGESEALQLAWERLALVDPDWHTYAHGGTDASRTKDQEALAEVADLVIALDELPHGAIALDRETLHKALDLITTEFEIEHHEEIMDGMEIGQLIDWHKKKLEEERGGA